MSTATKSVSTTATPAAVIASAKPGKEPKKAIKASSAKKVVKASAKNQKTDAKAPAGSGTPLKVFCSNYGLTPKQARVILRREWRSKEAGLLHSLRNRWIFNADQKRRAIKVFEAATFTE